MLALAQLVAYLDSQFPPTLAESWDNIGLLLGDPDQNVRKVMTCLTMTPETVQEAVENQADCIITHHPFPFHAVQQINCKTVPGKMLWSLIGAKIALYSPHTAHDNADCGINQQLAVGLGLEDIRPLFLTAGRIGRFSQPTPLQKVLEKIKSLLNITQMMYVDSGKPLISQIAIACGAAGDFLEQAIAQSADVFLLGEARFHTCLDAQSQGISLALPGHYASERFAMERLALRIAESFPNLNCWSSNQETDPLKYA
ncbi:MAG: Nif3-like dinuclear metal center hexameric protein [Thermoguttaceae bacterium]